MLFKNSFRFPNMFNAITGETMLDTEYTSINRCIALILTTARGELLGDPDFGCTLYEQLFNVHTESLDDIIKTDIVNSLNKYEKRINISKTDIEIRQDSNNKNAYIIHINYTIKNSNENGSVEVNINQEDSVRYE